MFGELEGKIYVAFSPERADPTNKLWNIKNTPKLIAGVNAESLAKASEFYLKIVDEVVPCESLEVAETAKLLENAFRLINISFVNEISDFCQKAGIEVSDVIKAAATKPYGFMPFYPGVGIGGHCIPVDPLYLAAAAKKVGASNKFIELAQRINKARPEYFTKRAEEILGNLKDKRILVIGISYKPNVADMRETPVHSLVLSLRKKGALVFWHDELVKEWNGETTTALGNNFDLVILATRHDYLDLSKIKNVKLLNTRNSI
jgi:UDP-N-acetyl-D-glucosamine dehydrogenase